MDVYFDLRPARADDFESLAALSTACADTGRIAVAPRYLSNPVEAWAALKPELEWVVAETEDGLIGGGQVIFSDAEVEGESHRCACLASLMVHPDHRRRGVAKAVTAWRLDRAGDDAVVVAAIQAGNEGSLANAGSWATQIFGTLTLPVFRASRRSANVRGLEIREPRVDSEWEAAARGLAEFERGWNLRTPDTGTSLRLRAGRELEGRRVQRYVVAAEGERIVGGYELFDGGRLQTLVFEHLPFELRALNVFLRIVPRSGELAQASLSRVWFEDGREDVARALWSHARSSAAESGNAVGTQFDPRGPLGGLFPVRPWTPSGRVSVAVRSPVTLSEERLLSPP